MQFAVVELGPVQTTMNVDSEVLHLTRRKASISVSELQDGPHFNSNSHRAA